MIVDDINKEFDLDFLTLKSEADKKVTSDYLEGLDPDKAMNRGIGFGIRIGRKLEELKAGKELLDKVSDFFIYNSHISKDYKLYNHPVAVETFLEDSYFMGDIGNKLFPKVKESIIEIVNGDFNEIIFSGGLGTSKTTRANIILIYDLYKKLCLENDNFNVLLSSHNISISHHVMRSKLEDTIKDLPFAKNNLFVNCNFVYDRGYKLNNELLYAYLDRDIKTFEQESYNRLYEHINKIANGKIINITSRTSSRDFTALRIDELQGFSGHVTMYKSGFSIGKTFISEGAIWDFKPEDYYCGLKFEHVIGDLTISIPIEYKSEFENSPSTFLKDYVGIV